MCCMQRKGVIWVRRCRFLCNGVNYVVLHVLHCMFCIVPAGWYGLQRVLQVTDERTVGSSFGPDGRVSASSSAEVQCLCHSCLPLSLPTFRQHNYTPLNRTELFFGLWCRFYLSYLLKCSGYCPPLQSRGPWFEFRSRASCFINRIITNWAFLHWTRWEYYSDWSLLLRWWYLEWIVFSEQRGRICDMYLLSYCCPVFKFSFICIPLISCFVCYSVIVVFILHSNIVQWCLRIHMNWTNYARLRRNS
jgi:hypothetical protein